MMARVLERLPEWVNGDAALVRRGRYLSATFLVEVGDTAWLVTVHEGRWAYCDSPVEEDHDWVASGGIPLELLRYRSSPVSAEARSV